MTTLIATMLNSDAMWRWIRGLGGPGLILLGLADNTPFVSAPPGSVDACLIVLAARNPSWWAYFGLMATIGEVLGGYVTYRLAEKGGRQTLEKQVGQQRAKSIYKGFERFGGMTVLGGALLPPPFPFTSVLMTAGVMQYPRKKFATMLTLGRGIRFLAVAYLGRVYGSQMIGFFARHYRTSMYVLIGLGILSGAAALAYFLWYRPRHQTKRT